jgi:hypothetical protein
VESWPRGGDCPFPGGDEDNFEVLVNGGIDTWYMYFGGSSSCSYDPDAVINTLGPTLDDFNVLIGDDFKDHLDDPDADTLISDTSAVAGFLTGDESDMEIYDEGVPRASIKAGYARQMWDLYPELTVYNGAATNRNVGSFAGMSDVQGMDFYVAACAPHITNWGTHPPLRGSYDYLRNARNNHAPLPTWLYAQGLSSVWNKDGALGEVHVQPDPQEIYVQAFSALAAGGKGLMWFQTNQDEIDHAPARWRAISRSSWVFRGLRSRLRRGDATGAASTAGNAIVEAIRAPDAIVVPVINLEHTSAPTDVGCAAAFLTEALVPHWVLADQLVDVTVDVPDDLAVHELFEVLVDDSGEQVVPAPYAVTVSGREITIADLPLSNDVPVRILVLATNENVAAEVAADLAH